MLQIFLPMLAAVVALLLFAALGTRWAVDWMQRRLLEKQRAADCIINDGQVPEPWIGRFRLRFAEARQAGSSSGELEEVGRRAQQHAPQHQSDQDQRGDEGGHGPRSGRVQADEEAAQHERRGVEQQLAIDAGRGWTFVDEFARDRRAHWDTNSAMSATRLSGCSRP